MVTQNVGEEEAVLHKGKEEEEAALHKGEEEEEAALRMVEEEDEGSGTQEGDPEHTK